MLLPLPLQKKWARRGSSHLFSESPNYNALRSGVGLSFMLPKSNSFWFQLINRKSLVKAFKKLLVNFDSTQKRRGKKSRSSAHVPRHKALVFYFAKRRHARWQSIMWQSVQTSPTAWYVPLLSLSGFSPSSYSTMPCGCHMVEGSLPTSTKLCLALYGHLYHVLLHHLHKP